MSEDIVVMHFLINIQGQTGFRTGSSSDLRVFTSIHGPPAKNKNSLTVGLVTNYRSKVEDDLKRCGSAESGAHGKNGTTGTSVPALSGRLRLTHGRRGDVPDRNSRGDNVLIRLADHVPVTAYPEVWVAPSAVLIGQVTIGRDASVWFGAVVRADNEPVIIGEGSNVQDNCVLHTDPGFPLTVGHHCTIGHQAVLHGCTIGDGSLVGIGAIILNGAVIGKNCLIGAGALIPEGVSVPDRSLVIGVPGKVRRELSDEEILRMIQNAEQYVQKSQWYSQHAVVSPG